MVQEAQEIQCLHAARLHIHGVVNQFSKEGDVMSDKECSKLLRAWGIYAYKDVKPNLCKMGFRNYMKNRFSRLSMEKPDWIPQDNQYYRTILREYLRFLAETGPDNYEEMLCYASDMFSKWREVTYHSIDKAIVGYHEAGHAYVAYKLGCIVRSVSSESSGCDAGGTAWEMPMDPIPSLGEQAWIAMQIAIGGTIAERLLCSDNSKDNTVLGRPDSDMKKALSYALKIIMLDQCPKDLMGLSLSLESILNRAKQNVNEMIASDLALPTNESKIRSLAAALVGGRTIPYSQLYMFHEK